MNFEGVEVTVEYVQNQSYRPAPSEDEEVAVKVSLVKGDVVSTEVTHSCTTSYVQVAVPSIAFDEKILFPYNEERRMEFVLLKKLNNYYEPLPLGKYMLSLTRFSPDKRVLAACMTLKTLDSSSSVVSTEFCLNVRVKMVYERPPCAEVKPPAPISSTLASKFRSLHVNVLQFKLGHQYRIEPSEGAYVSLSLRGTTLRTPIQDDFVFNTAFEFPYRGEPVFRVAVHFTNRDKIDRRVLFYKIDLESLSRTNRMFDLQAKSASSTGSNKSSSAIRGSLVMHLCLSPAPSKGPQVFPLIERPFSPVPGGPSLWASGESPGDLSSGISDPSPPCFALSDLSVTSKDFLAHEAASLRTGFTVVDVVSLSKISVPSKWSSEMRDEMLEGNSILGRVGSLVVVVYQITFEDVVPNEILTGNTAVDLSIGQHSIKIEVPEISDKVGLLNRAFLFPFRGERYFYCGLTGSYKEDGFLDLCRFVCGERGNVLACSVPLPVLKGRVFVRLEKRESMATSMTDLTAKWDSF